MPSTAVYLVLPASMAWMAASLMLAGVSKSGSPAPRPMTLRPAAFSARALSVTAMVADGFTRSSAADRKGIIISLHREHTMCRSDPRIFLLGSRYPKAGHAAPQEACAKAAKTSENVKSRPIRLRNIHKVLRRNDSYMARAAIWRMADGDTCT